jgi:hypothetical protein
MGILNFEILAPPLTESTFHISVMYCLVLSMEIWNSILKSELHQQKIFYL